MLSAVVQQVLGSKDVCRHHTYRVGRKELRPSMARGMDDVVEGCISRQGSIDIVSAEVKPGIDGIPLKPPVGSLHISACCIHLTAHAVVHQQVYHGGTYQTGSSSHQDVFARQFVISYFNHVSLDVCSNALSISRSSTVVILIFFSEPGTMCIS